MGCDEAYLNECIAKASKSWEGVDVDKFMDEVRGREQEQAEVDFEIGKYMTTNLLKKRNHSTGIFHLTQKDYATIARHFYELGLKARKEEK